MIRFLRDFREAFWVGYEKAVRRAREKRTRNDAHARLKAAMTRYGLPAKDRRYMAGRKS